LNATCHNAEQVMQQNHLTYVRLNTRSESWPISVLSRSLSSRIPEKAQLSWQSLHTHHSLWPFNVIRSKFCSTHAGAARGNDSLLTPRCPVRTSARPSAVLTEISRCGPPSLQPNSEIVPRLCYGRFPANHLQFFTHRSPYYSTPHTSFTDSVTHHTTKTDQMVQSRSPCRSDRRQRTPTSSTTKETSVGDRHFKLWAWW
jgi:hypothetical protein